MSNEPDERQTGPFVLREKPKTDLIDRNVYLLPDDPTRDDYARCADWVRFFGGEVPFFNDDGMLVVSTYVTDDEYNGHRYYEWMSGDSMLIFNPESSEFSCYGYSMREHYLTDPWTGEKADDHTSAAARARLHLPARHGVFDLTIDAPRDGRPDTTTDSDGGTSMTAQPSDEAVEHYCEVMHDAYEAAAVESGWLTQERSRVPWADVPEANKATMRIAVRAALAAAEPAMTAAARADERERGDLTTLLHAQREWSEATFGPGDRLAGLLDHLRKELAEVEANPTDVSEWIDVVILALDGAWRSGHTPEQIVAALNAKYEKNRNRVWPDWRTAPEGTAIEHVRIARGETDG